VISTGDFTPDRRASLRASDADREAVAQVLRDAAADGRLGMDEIDDRLSATFAARTFGDLDRVTWDLVAAKPPAAAVPAHGSTDGLLRLTAVVDDVKRSGRWHAPERIVATAQIGSVKLDFSDAVLAGPVIEVVAWANVGSVTLLVPEGWRVDVDGVSGGIGSVKNKTIPPTAGTPTIKVTGRATVGDVVVRHPRNSRWLPR